MTIALLSAPVYAEDFTLQDGDRVVLLGGTLIEREQRSAYLEALFTSQYPRARVSFRNLGWSGDTVFGDARAGFGGAEDGFRHLREHVLAEAPTVILLAYGANEAFEGEGGLDRFRKGYVRLLEALSPSRARFILVAPLPHEALSAPLPSPRARNDSLRRYSRVIRELSATGGHRFLDLGEAIRQLPPGVHVTDNGLHPTPWGYWRLGQLLQKSLGLPEPGWEIEVDAREQGAAAQLRATRGDATGAIQSRTPLRFVVTSGQLPNCPEPEHVGGKGSPPADLRLAIKNLPRGNWELKSGGQTLAKGSETAWSQGIVLFRSPDRDQAEQLRKVIIEKNQLYFHRWRPQNETYLFGFRKHEQGQNAKEIVQFDPLIARLEQEIVSLRQPREYTYELVPGSEK